MSEDYFCLLWWLWLFFLFHIFFSLVLDYKKLVKISLTYIVWSYRTSCLQCCGSYRMCWWHFNSLGQPGLLYLSHSQWTQLSSSIFPRIFYSDILLTLTEVLWLFIYKALLGFHRIHNQGHDVFFHFRHWINFLNISFQIHCSLSCLILFQRLWFQISTKLLLFDWEQQEGYVKPIFLQWLFMEALNSFFQSSLVNWFTMHLSFSEL